MTALHRNSKPDTIFLGIKPEAGISVDLSEQRIDLVLADDVASETPSARGAVTYPRELSVVVSVVQGDDGTVLYHGRAGGGGYTYRMRLTFAGALEVSENGILRASVLLPGLDNTEPRRFLLHWSSRLAGATVHSEVLVSNLDTGQTEVAYVSYSDTSGTDPTWDLVVGGGAGDNFTAGLSRIEAARVSRRFHSTTEAREDWMSETTPPADGVGIRRRSALEFDRQEIALAEDGQFAGPAYLWAGASARDNDRRCISPLINLRIDDPLSISKAETPANWHRPSPIDPAFTIALAHLFYRPCNSNRAHVRIFVSQTLADGDDATTGPITWRMLSTPQVPNFANPEALTKSIGASETVVCTNKHPFGPTDGEWLDLGVMPLSVDAWGCTWLMLSWSFGDGSIAEDTVARVRAIVVDPFSTPDQNTFDKTI